MPDRIWLGRQAGASLRRLAPRLEAQFASEVGEAEWQGYARRLEERFGELFELLYSLYGGQYDFFYHLEAILGAATRMWIDRPAPLKALDAARLADPTWFLSRRMVGATCYTQLFGGDLEGLRRSVPYLMELGITYLHLMPLFQSPEGDNDGGYAISSYRDVDPRLGTLEQLRDLAASLRSHGISLVLDFVFNHTSDEHAWARRAYAGDVDYQDFYYMFPDRQQPDAYERSIPEVFRDDHPGCFTYRSRIRRWVWTSFHNYQWDLNYANPAVFEAMVREMLFLANLGVEVLRLDAVAFIWKRLGTTCQNQPEVHAIIRAFNLIARIAAPALLFKSEAIVHPDEVSRYIGRGECQLSYNPQLMALLWEALATRSTRLLRRGLEQRFALPRGCAWVNYVRCHDDIGWAFSDDDARALGIDPGEHRRFLNAFYTGRFEGSFACGLPFQEDAASGEGRISGTAASLAGIEKALAEGDAEALDLAVRRLLLLYAVILTIGGIPLIYLGDELAMLNDYGYERAPEKEGDTRWVHRPAFDWDRAAERRELETLPGRVFRGMLQLIQVRQRTPALEDGDTDFADLGCDEVLSYFRQCEDQSVLVIANFSEAPQQLIATRLRHLGVSKTVTDLVSGRSITATRALEVEPYQVMVLAGVR